MPMNAELADEIIRRAKSGAEILFGQGVYGEFKIKIRHGPFKLLSRRYQVDFETFQFVKDQLHKLPARH